MDSLRVLFTDPVDYLVTPRVLAAMVAGPILNSLCFAMGKRSYGILPAVREDREDTSQQRSV